MAVDGEAVVVRERDRLPKAEVPGIGARLVKGALLKAAPLLAASVGYSPRARRDVGVMSKTRSVKKTVMTTPKCKSKDTSARAP